MLLPSEPELAAAANASASAASAAAAWLGCLLGKGTIMAGRVLQVLSGVASAEACCRRCRQQYSTAGGCTVWNYCGTQGGCRCAWGHLQDSLWVRCGCHGVLSASLVPPLPLP